MNLPREFLNEKVIERDAQSRKDLMIQKAIKETSAVPQAEALKVIGDRWYDQKSLH
jgi:hypothetical protein